MAENVPFRHVDITPSYARGFSFAWDIHPAFYDDGPWLFQVQMAETQEGPWDPISPILVDQHAWESTESMLAPKDPILYFRIQLRTGSKEYYSTVLSPYGSLPRREFLIVKDIIRRELLQQRLMSGVCCQLWRKSVIGPRCTECSDFVTGEPISGSCADCYGTGIKPGYHGPYPVWATFSTATRDKKMENDQTGVKEQYTHIARVVGTIRLKNDDIIVDPSSDQRYFIDVVKNLMEVRRYPVVQDTMVRQIALGHPVFNLGV